MERFSSDGFDLDAVPSEKGDGVVYEVGGGATIISPVTEDETDQNAADTTAAAEELKQKGNDKFKAGFYSEAYDLYTDAIEACPGELKAEEILKLRDQFEESKREEAMSRHRQATEELKQQGAKKEEQSKESSSSSETTPEEYALPPQPFGDKLAIYYCNRAATLLHMSRFQDAINDCDVAILLNPKYAKAFVRRSMAYEKSEETDKALSDSKKALALDPKNATIRTSVARLQKIEDERLEKLKAETIGKLKDLGNSILGNFGLSLDNFQTVQDPKTGSYNIQFNQNK